MKKQPNTLSIDIGGTNINSSVINSSMSIDELNKAQINTIKTQGWLNKTLPEFINHEKLKSLVNESDLISFCGPFRIDDSDDKIARDHYHVTELGVPENLAQKISDKVGKPVTIKNDAVAWSEGIFRYHELIEKDIAFPVLTISLGTGVGMAITHERDEIMNYDISYRLSGSVFKKLTDTANYYPWMGKNPTAGKVHQILGYNFHTWVKKEKPNWSKSKIQREYTKRLIAFLFDLRYHTKFVYSKVKTIFLCGGSTKYLSNEILQKSEEDHIKSKNFIIVDENSVEINPDKLPLIGNLK